MSVMSARPAIGNRMCVSNVRPTIGNRMCVSNVSQAYYRESDVC